jgi:hypothetical protein
MCYQLKVVAHPLLPVVPHTAMREREGEKRPRREEKEGERKKKGKRTRKKK